MKKNNSGSTLVAVMIITLVVMVVVSTAVDYTNNINRNVQRSNTLQQAGAVADGAVDYAFGYWREICRNQSNLAMSSSSFSSIPLPASSMFPTVTNYSAKAGVVADNTDEFDATKTISNFKVIAVDPQLNAYASSSTTPVPAMGEANTGVQATSSASFEYLASVDVTLPTLRGPVTSKLRRVFEKQQLSPWNYAIFYVDPLEIHPGPAFTVTGWVHTNSNLYTAHNSLTFADRVTYTSDWFVNFMPADARYGVEVPSPPNYRSNLPPALDVAHQPFGLDSNRIFNSTDPNPNNDSYHELVEQPVTGYTDPLAGSRYFDQASFKILVDASNNITIERSDNTVINGSSTGQDKINYNALRSAITTGGSLQDARQGATMRLTTVNVGSLVTSVSTGNLKGFNGILYVSGATTGAGNLPAIKLVNGSILPGSTINGSTLPGNGLTVASNNSIYIQGDYNTGATGSSVPSNSGDPTTPQASGYTRAPASVVGDAVTILSNSWSDSNSTKGLYSGSRVATPTTVNTAIVAGVVPTTSSNYSGGAENFPRFLEDWRNQSFTYYGSMVELFQSKTNTGPWVYGGNVYEAPLRKWYFDTNFRIKPPPGSLMVYSYSKGRWFNM